jgi:glycosyltransferase involved in cell wall biosynthesis
MKLSVVMPVFNEARHIDQQLGALAAQTYPGDWELIVADNGSTDGTQGIVESWMTRLPVRVVDAGARRGCGPARNQGVEAARGDALLFCDADDIVEPGWLGAHGSALDRVALSAGAIVFFQETPAPVAEVPSAAPTLLGWLPYAQGANCGVRREAYDAVGGFNEANRYAEDVEFSWAVQLAGFSLAYTPGAVVQKRVRTTARELFVQSYRYGLCDVDMYRRYRAHGASRAPGRDAARTYLGLLARLPALASPVVRERWLRQAGRRSGRLVGSMRDRTFLP